ncbi:alpha/beta hydrolase family protein [Microbacterium sp. MC2]
MLGLRRAGPVGAPPALVTALRALIVALSAALVGILGVTSFVAVRMARRVVTPGGRMPDTRILNIDTSAQTITLSRTADTVLPGRYGLFTVGSADYLKLGSVLSEDATGVKRKLLTHVPSDAHLAPEAAFSGWYFDDPDELRLPYTNELIGTPVGPCPAWLFPVDGADTWVIQIHGRGTTRTECLRAVPVFHAAGITSMVVSYRNDSEAPRSRSGTYTLGATEWHDVEPALAFAQRRGARRIILMGWSMGGAIALQVALHSAHRDLIAGLVLDSPVLDWRRVLDHQARLLGLPSQLAELAVGTLQQEWSAGLSGGAAIDFRRLDGVARASELRHPILILHSDDDGFVPSNASHDLAAARPDLVELQSFSVARHTKLWNYDQQRWTAAITSWLERVGLTAHAD